MNVFGAANSTNKMLTLLVVLIILACGATFRYGLGRLAPLFSKRKILEQSKSSLSSQSDRNIDLVALDELIRSVTLKRTQTPPNATLYPAIHNSSYLAAKYPDPQNRTVQNILSGLSDVTDIEYLNILPNNDPRRRLLATIQEPGLERRAELEVNLQAIDAERGSAAKKESTFSLYQKLSREGIDTDLEQMLEKAAGEETLRRERPEFTESMNPEWDSLLGSEELTSFVEQCVEKRKTGLVCKHPALFVWFPYYKKGTPPTDHSLTELYGMRTKKAVSRNILNGVLTDKIYPAIAQSPMIAEKYPDRADRTPHNLLGGLANIVSIEYMQSLEPHDPRRLFLDTMNPPDEQRCAELERNAVLVDRAVTERENYEPGQFSVRDILLHLVREALEENYLTTLIAAKHSEQRRKYAKNGGVEGTDPEHDAYRKSLAEATAYFSKDTPQAF